MAIKKAKPLNSRFKDGLPKQKFQVGNVEVTKEKFEEARTASTDPIAREKEGSKISPEVNEALRLSEENSMKNQIIRRNILAERQKRIFESEGKRLGIIPDEPIITPPTLTPPSSASRAADFENELNAQGINTNPETNSLLDKAQISFGDERIKRAFKQTFRRETVVGIIDSITGAGLGFREPITIKKANKVFNELETELNKGIKELAEGGGNPAEIKQQLQAAADALSRMQEFQHDKGLQKIYLNYWVDNGADVEAKIITMQTAIERMLAQAEEAEIAGNIARTRAFLGEEDGQG